MASNAPLAQMIQLIVLTCCALGAVYFVFYRPTVNAQNRQRRVIAGLRQGDEIVTTAGFIARIADIREPDDGPVELLLDLGDGRLVRARTTAVADRLPRPAERAEEERPSEAAAQVRDADDHEPSASTLPASAPASTPTPERPRGATRPAAATRPGRRR